MHLSVAWVVGLVRITTPKSVLHADGLCSQNMKRGYCSRPILYVLRRSWEHELVGSLAKAVGHFNRAQVFRRVYFFCCVFLPEKRECTDLATLEDGNPKQGK